MKRLSLLFMCVCLSVNMAGQDIYSQQQALADMLSRNEFFEARKQRKLCGDTLDKSLELCYAFKMHGYLNRPDSSAIYLERLLKEYPDFFGNRESKMYFANRLLDLYSDIGNYRKQLRAYDTVEEIVKSYLSGEDSIGARQHLKVISRLRQIPKARMGIPQMAVTNLSKKKEVSITFTEEPVLTSIIECNGLSMKTWIDTGCGYAVFMTKSIADSCKVEDLPLSGDSIYVNGTLTCAHRALVDSLRIGSILFTHVPAIVVYNDFVALSPKNTLSDEKQQKYNSIMNSTGLVIGLPLLRRLGSIQFNWNKRKIKMKLPADVAVNEDAPNMFIGDMNLLYTQLFLNALEYTGIVDTGAPNTCIDITKQYYENHKENLPVDETVKEKSTNLGGFTRISVVNYRPILHPTVLFDSKEVKLKEEDVIAWQNTPYGGTENNGLFGYQFLKRLGKKVKLDFVNMQIMAE